MSQSNENLRLKILKTDFVKLRVSVKELVQEIRLHTGSQSELDDISSLVRLKNSQLHKQIEELQKLYYELDQGEEKRLISKEIEEWKEQVCDDHHTFRNVLLAAQLAVTQRNKNELFGLDSEDSTKDSEGGTLKHREKMSREIMMKKSAELTDDLLMVTRMIKDNTEKSTRTLDKLVESSQMVTSTQEELKTMGSVIGQAKKILNKYGRRENTDK
ncbi:Vesicle transport protein SEC20, partial [Armadillidium nasatum]